MMNEHIVQMGPMLILAGLSAGWLAESFLIRRGYGLIVDMGLGVGAGIAGGSALVALSGPPAGMLVMFGVGSSWRAARSSLRGSGGRVRPVRGSRGRSFASSSWVARLLAGKERL